MAKTKRARIEEAEVLTDTDLELPPVETELPPVEEIPPVEPEVANNAYLDLIQDILKKEWDVINSCDGLIATLSVDEAATFDKEAVSAIFREVADKITTVVGMTTKALSVIDPTQEELMKDGEEAAEDAMNMAEKKPAEESLEEDRDGQGFARFNLTLKNKRGKEYQKQDTMLLGAKNLFGVKLDDVRRYFQHYYKDRIVKLEPVGFINEDYEIVSNLANEHTGDTLFPDSNLSERYWAYEVLWNLENLLGMHTEEELAEDDVLLFLDNLDEEEIKNFCKGVAYRIISYNDYLWEDINSTIDEVIRNLARQRMIDTGWNNENVYQIGSENPEEDK